MNVAGIKVVDATLRDGGLVNDFYFDDKFVKALYEANIAAGVDYMEFGYRASKKQFDPSAFGKWKFTNDEDVWKSIGEKDSRMKLSVMVDVGRTDYKEDIKPRKDSPIDIFRVATYIDTIPEAVEMINHISTLAMRRPKISWPFQNVVMNKSLRLYINYQTSHLQSMWLTANLCIQNKKKATRLYHNILGPTGKEVGMHAHNNQQCAFANTIEAKDCGAKWLDGTDLAWGATGRQLSSKLPVSKWKNTCRADFETRRRLDAANEGSRN